MAAKIQTEIAPVETTDDLAEQFEAALPEWNVSEANCEEMLSTLDPRDNRILFSVPRWLAGKKFGMDDEIYHAELVRETEKAFLLNYVLAASATSWNKDKIVYEAWVPKSQIGLLARRV